MTEATSIATIFEDFAIDHAPDGWPAVKQMHLTAAAAELRRLQTAEDELLEALSACRDAMPPTAADDGEAIGHPTSVPAYVRKSVSLLTAQRDELLAALQRIADASMSMYATRADMLADCREVAIAAIAKAEGGAAPRPAPMQEPYAWCVKGTGLFSFGSERPFDVDVWTALYTAPRKAVKLTDLELLELWEAAPLGTLVSTRLQSVQAAVLAKNGWTG